MTQLLRRIMLGFPVLCTLLVSIGCTSLGGQSTATDPLAPLLRKAKNSFMRETLTVPSPASRSYRPGAGSGGRLECSRVCQEPTK